MKHLSASLSLSYVASLLAAACGGGGGAGKGDTVTNVTNESALKGPDNSVLVDGIALKGMRLSPEALDRPGMPIVEDRKKTTVEKQRAAIDKATDNEDREVLSQVLATTLYLQSKAEKDASKQGAIIDESRNVLRAAITKSGGKAVDSVTLQMLGTLDLLREDYGAAEKAWRELVEKNPKAKDVVDSTTWWALAALKAGNNASALQAVSGAKVGADQPGLAYVTGWAKFRSGDAAGAWQAILAAAKGWKEAGTKSLVERDLLVIAGRSGTPAADAAAALLAMYKTDGHTVLYKLATSYGMAGRYADQIVAIDKAIEAAGSKVGKTDLPTLRRLQMQASIRIDSPDKTAAYGKAALDALAACGAECAAIAGDVRAEVRNFATLFHRIYSTAEDQRYYQPAHDMYGWVIAAGDASADLAKQAASLETTKGVIAKAAAAGKAGERGAHEPASMQHLVRLQLQQVQACYELELGSNPSLTGKLSLTLEVANTGEVTGATSDPAAGAEAIPAIARCATAAAKQWKFPARASQGVTRIVASFELAGVAK